MVNKLDVSKSNSERVKIAETFLKEKGADYSRKAENVIIKELAGMTRREFEKAKTVIDSQNQEFLLRLNKLGITSAFNKVKPADKKPKKCSLKDRYGLSVDSYDILEWLAHHLNEKKGALLEGAFLDQYADYVDKYNEYSNEARLIAFAYPSNKLNGADEE